MTPLLLLSDVAATKVLHDASWPWYQPAGYFRGTSSVPVTFEPNDSARLKDDIVEWCAENLSHQVVVLYSWGGGCHALSFGSDEDHVIFKTVWI